MMYARIAGVGSYLPGSPVSNDDLARRGVAVDIVDVDDDRELEARYGELVPVLLHQGVELCHYFQRALSVVAPKMRLGQWV